MIATVNSECDCDRDRECERCKQAIKEAYWIGFRDGCRKSSRREEEIDECEE